MTDQLATLAALTSGRDTWNTSAAELPGRSLVALKLADGPHGLRRPRRNANPMDLDATIAATCFPPACGLAAAWNPELTRRVGEALGREARALDVDVLLGPGMNIKRSPLGGRNFEYFSEDPTLTAVLAAAMVESIQSVGVGACIKHFAVNNQETDRLRVSAEVDERALREVYLAAFEHVVRTARPWMVMSSYNRVNGTPASENEWLLTTVLREEWGFDGVVVSDWGAIRNRVAAVAAGNDLEMPPSGTDDEIVAAVESGALAAGVLDHVADRFALLQQRVRAGLPPRADHADDPGDADLTALRAANHDIALAAARECAVLLKNESGALPIDASAAGIAVVGELARTPRYQGGGSSHVTPTNLRAALDALQERLGDRVQFAPGYALDGAGTPALADDAAALAASADITVVFAGLPDSAESEGFDRTAIELPADQIAVIEAVAAVARRVVVVLSNGGVVATNGWGDRVDAILETWLLGQAGGDAVTELLLGDHSPSGRLAETIPLRLADHPSHLTFPGRDGSVVYGESVFVGYRHFDTLDVPVQYPFGHGLTYSAFEYGDLVVESARADADPAGGWRVAFTVANIGDRAAAEVAQMYIGKIEAAPSRPTRALRGFAKVAVEPGGSVRVELPVTSRDLSIWDVRNQRWALDPGDYTIAVGASSRDVRLTATISTSGDGFRPELTAVATVGEWLDDPIGGPVLRAFVQERVGFDLDQLDPTMRAMADSMPLISLRTFGMGLDAGTIEGLVADAAAARTQVSR